MIDTIHNVWLRRLAVVVFLPLLGLALIIVGALVSTMAEINQCGRDAKLLWRVR